MAKYNHGFGISFNDNDGGAAWFSTSEGLDDYRRYAEVMGVWRARLFFLWKFWRVVLPRVEGFAQVERLPKWKRLNGWKP